MELLTQLPGGVDSTVIYAGTSTCVSAYCCSSIAIPSTYNPQFKHSLTPDATQPVCRTAAISRTAHSARTASLAPAWWLGVK